VIKALLPLAAPILFAIAASSLASAQALPAPQFTTASLKGTCGFTQASNQVKSTDPHFLPQPMVGTLTFNGTGAVSLTGSRNNAGTVKPVTQSGNYLVGADGRTGTMDFSAAGGGVLQFVITGGGAQLRFINTGKVNPATGLLDQVLVGQCDF
jgi:hypothetical protein